MEHLTQKHIEDYAQNCITAAELLAASDHLDECEACRARVEAGLNIESMFFAMHEEAFAGNETPRGHLTSEQTAEYVDKNLSGDELQFVTDHLSSCEQCRLQLMICARFEIRLRRRWTVTMVQCLLHQSFASHGGLFHCLREDPCLRLLLRCWRSWGCC